MLVYNRVANTLRAPPRMVPQTHVPDRVPGPVDAWGNAVAPPGSQIPHGTAHTNPEAHDLPPPPPAYVPDADPAVKPSWPARLDELFVGPVPKLLSEARMQEMRAIETKMHDDDQCIETWDERLGDPHTLADFIRYQASVPLTTKITGKGKYHLSDPGLQRTHTDTDTDGAGTSKEWMDAAQYHSSKSHYRIVRDFTFTIDVTPVYEGGLELAVNPPATMPASGDAATSDPEEDPDWDLRSDSSFGSYRVPSKPTKPKPKSRALGASASACTTSSDDLETWCAAFLADPCKNKALVLNKVVVGWQFSKILKDILGWIADTGYQGDVSLQRVQTARRVIVRPPAAGRARRVWQRIKSGSVKNYIVGTARYRTEIYPPLPLTHTLESLDEARARLPGLGLTGAQIGPGPQGIHYLVGVPLDAWVKYYQALVSLIVKRRTSYGVIPVGPK